MRRTFPALLVLAVLAGPAGAGDVATAPNLAVIQTGLPTPPQAPPPNPWAGLTVGSDIFGVAGKGVRGGVGGGGFLGFDRPLDDNMFVSLRANAGYSPAWWGFGPTKGVDYGLATMKVGYDAGRWRAWVIGGFGLEKPNSYGFAGAPNAGDSLNNLSIGAAHVRPMGVAGVGAEYQINENLRVGVSVTTVQGRGLIPPPP